MVNAADLKSAAAKAACGFEPHSRHWELLGNLAGQGMGVGVGLQGAGTIEVLPGRRAARKLPRLCGCFGKQSRNRLSITKDQCAL
jgi:hypothetical protein